MVNIVAYFLLVFLLWLDVYNSYEQLLSGIFWEGDVRRSACYAAVPIGWTLFMPSDSQ